MAYNMKYWLNVLPIKHLILGIVIVFLIGGTASYFVLANKTSSKKVLSAQIIKPTNTPIPTITPTSSNTPTPTIHIYEQTIQPQVTQAPLIDCVGADGKHMQIIQKACDDFNKAWGNISTPTPQPQISGGSTTQNENINFQLSTNAQPSPLVHVNIPPVNTASVIAPDCSFVNSGIAAIKGEEQIAVDSQISTTNAELGRRGIVPSGNSNGLYEQTMAQATQSIQTQYSNQIAQFCINATLKGCSCP